MRAARLSVAALLALAACALVAPAAQGSFHLIKIREVHPDTSGSGDYVELQMYAAGQNLVAGRYLGIYNAGAPFMSSPYLIPSNAINGENQRTILIGNTGAPGSPDFVVAGLEIPSQGSACWLSSIAPDVGLDCVSFGESFVGAPSPTGTPAPVIPTGQSLIRSITPNCNTLLEEADDTNNSSADFALGAPNPRNNSVTPTEVDCTPPVTTITKGPKKKVKTKKKKAKVQFEFDSSKPNSTFQCKLDKAAFATCTSPFSAKAKKGKHTFQVQATDSGGHTELAPVQQKFKVKRKR